MTNDKKVDYLVAVFLPEDLIEREAKKSLDFVEEDLKIFHEACVKTFNSISKQSEKDSQ